MEIDAAYTYEKDMQKSTLRKEKAKMGTKKKKEKNRRRKKHRRLIQKEKKCRNLLC